MIDTSEPNDPCAGLGPATAAAVIAGAADALVLAVGLVGGGGPSVTTTARVRRRRWPTIPSAALQQAGERTRAAESASIEASAGHRLAPSARRSSS